MDKLDHTLRDTAVRIDIRWMPDGLTAIRSTIRHITALPKAFHTAPGKLIL